ncbi:pol polyprotein [Vairimorpha necatrix]|uniref:Pol polyprotein n=1 Tax=Vairimorpha necatrix TaxID=6039 RepID=A0AAX4JG61_9MICR
MTKLETIRQVDFEKNLDYYEEIERIILIYGMITGLNKKESNARLHEAFNGGLGPCTAIELFERVDNNSTIDLLKYLQKLEEGIELRGTHAQTRITPSERRAIKQVIPPETGRYVETNKWCSVRRVKSHDTRDCYLKR